jgi:hypothetical protein
MHVVRVPAPTGFTVGRHRTVHRSAGRSAGLWGHGGAFRGRPATRVGWPTLGDGGGLRRLPGQSTVAMEASARVRSTAEGEGAES